MDNKEHRELLHQLKNEIKNTQAVDEKDSQLLRGLEGDVNAMLAGAGENPVQVHPSIVQRLESNVSHFEVHHPNLTIVITKLLDSLSGAGI